MTITRIELRVKMVSIFADPLIYTESIPAANHNTPVATCKIRPTHRLDLASSLSDRINMAAPPVRSYAVMFTLRE
jgi:hypothetical protein